MNNYILTALIQGATIGFMAGCVAGWGAAAFREQSRALKNYRREKLKDFLRFLTTPSRERTLIALTTLVFLLVPLPIFILFKGLKEVAESGAALSFVAGICWAYKWRSLGIAIAAIVVCYGLLLVSRFGATA